jgi:carbon monoxide dehydrogenase subunit G
MKWLLYVVAGLVAVVVLAVVVLLVLQKGESRLVATIDVARPPEVVFAWVTEPERVKRWIGWLKEIRNVTPEQGAVGARQVWVMEDRNNNNQLMEIDTEFVGYQPPTALTARVSATEGFTGTITYGLEPLGNGQTRLRYEGAYEFDHWLAKLLEPVITRSAQQKLDEDLARLKQQAEAEAVAIK